MRLSLIALTLALGCSTATAPVDAALADDAGVDAPAPRRDMGTDSGFDAAVLGACTLVTPPAFTIPAHTPLANGEASGLSDRDFYVLTALERLPGVSAAI